MLNRVTGWGGSVKGELSLLFTSMGKAVISKELLELVERIGECKAKQEEDEIIRREIAVLKASLSQPDALQGGRKLKEWLIRLIYCDMLGHDVNFGYIQAINATQMGNSLDKRVGFIACSLLMHESHELMILVINSISKCLKATDNLADMSSALSAVYKLLGKDYIPAVVDRIVELLTHPRELIRKKAVMALHRCLSRDWDAIVDPNEKARRALADKDPSVMAASVHIFYEFVSREPEKHKDLVSSFSNILRQVIERRLPMDYDYHRMPAPWLQVKLLQILALLGKDDATNSQLMYEVIGETLKRADIGLNAGSAVIYEAVRTITSIYPHPPLLDQAANAISSFIRSPSHNLKSLGINALSHLVQINPRYAAEHQMIVIDCLDDPDETIRRRTLDLLYKMTNTKNVKMIAEKMQQYLKTSTDPYLRKELVSRLTTIAEKWAPDSAWFVETMTNVFLLGGDLVQSDVAHNLMRLIAEGTGEDDEADNELRRYAVAKFVSCMEEIRMPDTLYHIISWTIGEYSYLSDLTSEQFLVKLCDLAERQYDNHETRGWILTAIMKIIPRHGSYPDFVRDLVEKYKSSISVDVQQRCYEIEQMVTQGTELMSETLPEDSSCEDIEVDPQLTFLNDYIRAALHSSPQMYIPPDQRHGLFDTVAKVDEEKRKTRKELYWTRPSTAPSHVGVGGGTLIPGASSIMATGPLSGAPSVLDPSPVPEPAAAPVTAELRLNVQGAKGTWGREGFKPSSSAALTTSNSGPSEGYKAVVMGGGDSNAGASSGSSAGGSAWGSHSGGSKKRDDKQPAVNAAKQAEAARLFSTGDDDAPPAPAPKGARRAAAKGAAAAAAPAPPVASAEKQPIIRSVSSASKPKPKAAAASTSKQAAAPAQTRSEGNLLDLDFLGPSQPATAPPAAKPPAADPFDILMGLGPSASAPASVPAGAAPAAAPSLMMPTAMKPAAVAKPSAAKPAAAKAPVPSASPQPAGHSIFDDLLGPAVSASPASPQPTASAPPISPQLSSSVLAPNITAGGLTVSAQDFARIPFPQWLSALADNQPRSAPQHQTLLSDNEVSVLFQKVYKAEETIAVFFVINVTDKPLANTTITLSAPSNLKMEVQSDQPSFGGADNVVKAILAPKQPLTIAARLSLLSHGLNMKLTGSIATGSGRPHNFGTQIEVVDFLRKYKMSTQLFGQNWGNHRHEKKLRATNISFKQPADFMAAMEKDYNMQPVQIIGLEGIVCAKLAAPAGQPEKLALLHAKLDAPNKAIDLTFRTQEPTFSEALYKYWGFSLK